VAATLHFRLGMRNYTIEAIAAVALGLLLSTDFGAASVAGAQDRPAVATGARLFMAHGCYGCHRVGALGTPIGPDLSKIGARYAETDLAEAERAHAAGDFPR
jgi:cytochrome c551/c552